MKKIAKDAPPVVISTITDASNKRNMKNTANNVNKHIMRNLKGNPQELYKAARHLITHGGKRLRPYMVIKSCQMLGGSTADALQAASAVEMVHNFTLVHDDIMDNDEMRHGVPTVHKKFGTPVAILAGDILFSKAYQTLTKNSHQKNSQHIPNMVSRLASACVQVCEGQMLDIKMAAENANVSIKKREYITMVKKKTAALFDVSCAMGAICADSKQTDVKNLSNFGLNLGIAFQITDDLIGAIGDPTITKKPVGNDVREGKKSLPILMALDAAKDTKHYKIISDVFGNHRSSKSKLNQAVESIRILGIETKVRTIACTYANKADKSLKPYTGDAKEELAALLGFVVKRSV